MSLSPSQVNQYYVFLASPGDVSVERHYVRQFFERYNRQTAQLWNVRFEVVDWENYSTIGVGRPQELITRQTLEKYRGSLALVIGIMGQRFGSPTGKAESGTEEEFNWAMESHKKYEFPEIKWFFRKVERLDTPTDPAQAREAIEQWEKVLAFRLRMQDLDNPVFYTEYPGPDAFRDIFENDLNRWLADSSRPWVPERADTTKAAATALSPTRKYYQNIERDFRRLDIAGIDNDRTFEIPLSEIYVRLRVMFDEDAPEETEAYDGGPIDIQTALLRYPKLVIVGDPGSGKSTFLKYIALMLARSLLNGSKEPIATYLLSLIERDADRALEWLQTRTAFGAKSIEALIPLPSSFTSRINSETRRAMTSAAVVYGHSGERALALGSLVRQWPDEITRRVLADRAVQDTD